MGQRSWKIFCYVIMGTRAGGHSPGEPKSGGHVTIIHQVLASIIQVFWVIVLPRSDKKVGL